MNDKRFVVIFRTATICWTFLALGAALNESTNWEIFACYMGLVNLLAYYRSKDKKPCQ